MKEETRQDYSDPNVESEKLEKEWQSDFYSSQTFDEAASGQAYLLVQIFYFLFRYLVFLFVNKSIIQ